MQPLVMERSRQKSIKSWVDGAYIETGVETESFDNVDPATGAVSAEVAIAGKDTVDRAVIAAKRALTDDWGKTSAAQRAEALYKVASEIERRFNEFLAAEIADTGKPVSLASHIDIPRGAANFRVFADIIRSASSETFQMKTADGTDVLNYSIRKPKGVVAVICPWNLPLLLMTWKVAPALACGNTVVVKPSEETPSTATLLGEVMRDAGIPDGVFNVVNGFGAVSTGEFLTSHPDVDAITFTGETQTGEAIMRAASIGTRDISLELGGKNPGIIFADTDLNAAIDTAARSVFANCGQVCLNTERLYVERPIFDEFVTGLKAKAEALVRGDPWADSTNMGPLISAEHREKVLSYYRQAEMDGAELITGGKASEMSGEFEGGFWVQPTLWTGLPETARNVREEIFGPCAHIQPFDDQDEAIALANDTEYGLASMVWTSDLTRAHQVAGQLDVGLCWVNSWFLRDLRTPFGGAKRSGIGREGGLHSLEFYSELSNVCIPH